jgi:hypothetical protein
MSRKLIFLSHIHEESELADVFKEAIEDEFAGFVEVFVSSYPMTIPAGTKLLSKIERGLIECVGAIYLISPTSVTRSWISFELGAVWIRSVGSERCRGPEIPTIPVCHSGCTPGDLPMPLNNLNAIRGAQSLELKRAFQSIQSAVGGKGSLKTDFNKLASKVVALEKVGLQQTQAPTIHSPQSRVVRPSRHYSPIDKDRIAEAFHQLRETLRNEADPLQTRVQRMYQAWRQRQSQRSAGKPIDVMHTIDQITSIRNDASRLSHKIFTVLIDENRSYDNLLRTVLDHGVPDPLRKLWQHVDRLKGALTCAEELYRESPHQSDKIVEVVVRILEPFSETNAQLNGWIHDTLRRIEEQEEMVLSRD